MITNYSVYNLKNKAIKRKIPLKCLLGVTMSSVNDVFVLHIDGDYDY